MRSPSESEPPIGREELRPVGPRERRRAWPAAATAAGLVVAAAGGVWLMVLRAGGEPRGAAMGLAAVGLVGVGLVAFCAGLGWYVLAPGLRGGAAAWQGVGSHRLVLACTLLAIVLSNLGPILHTLVRPGEGLCSVSGFLTAGLSVGLALLGVTYVRFIRPGILTADQLGVRADRLLRDVGTGLLLGLLVLFVSAAIQALLERFGMRQTQLQDIRCVKEFPPAGFVAVLFAGGVLAPIAEELYFRGFVFRTYLRSLGPLVAYGLSSLLFASLHLNLAAFLPILVLGLIFCWAYQRTGSIIPSMVAHAVNNSVAFVMLYFVNGPA